MDTAPSTHWLSLLTSFDPPRGLEAPPDWDEAVQFLSHHGLAAVAAYNLQYRMPDAHAPETAKDVLMGYYQGLSGDNVFKLVSLKQAFVDVEPGTKIVLLGGAAFAESLYPHIAFRPLPEVRLLVEERALSPVVAALAEARFLPVDPEEPDPDGPAATLYNDRFFLHLYTRFLPNPEEAGLFARAVPAKAFGQAMHRPAAEDALLLHALSLARRGFAVPLIELLDLRELVRGGSHTAGRGGPGAPLDPALVHERAKAFGVERPLYAALELLCHFHPQVEQKARALQPQLAKATRVLIDTTIVAPARDPMRARQLRGTETLTKLLFDGRS